MFTRVVEVQAKPGKARELCNTLSEKALPILRHQPGFVDEVVMVSHTQPDRVLGISFWRTQEDAERYNREQYPSVNELIQNQVASAPKVQTFNVDLSTSHRIAAGKAA
ncbi:MAG TPA: antibiotic biosynthesis monooxygenase [Terriglobales bacterium]|nr:antibiotic biosynthesis monooxygenase [Terriglobales bacterium]